MGRGTASTPLHAALGRRPVRSLVFNSSTFRFGQAAVSLDSGSSSRMGGSRVGDVQGRNGAEGQSRI